MSTEIDAAIDGAEEVAPDAEAIIAQLAALSTIDYERVRKDKAKALGFRPGVLDQLVTAQRLENDAGNADTDSETAIFVEYAPWPDKVDGGELLRDIEAAFERYIVLPDCAAPALALWVMHSHCHDAAYISPILTIESPDKRCGKTTAMGVAQVLVPRALPTSNISTAALFRAVEKWHPTVLIDEADTFLRDNDELRGVLNSGHNRSSARVIRTVGDDHEPKAFRTWAPKAIALIGDPPATLMDRSIIVPLRRKSPNETVQRFRMDRPGELEPLARRALRWAEDNTAALRTLDPEVSRSLNDRAADNWRALLAIADHVGGDWPTRAREAALVLSGDVSAEDASPGAMLLADMQSIFTGRGATAITTADLVSALVEMEERPWPEWYRGKPITGRGVARILKPYNIRPGKWRGGAGTERGYLKQDCEDAFARYLNNNAAIPPVPSATNATALENKGFPENLSATDAPFVADRIPGKVNENNAVSLVADKRGDTGHITENGGETGADPDWGTEL